MKHNYNIKYKRIELKPMSLMESEIYRKMRNKESVRKWFKSKEIISKEAQEQWYKEYVGRNNDIMFSIFSKEGELVGGVSVYDIDQNKKEAEFGRLLIECKSTEQKGMGVEAAEAISIIAKKELDLQILRLEVYEDNLAAIKTYLRSGFVYVKQDTDMDGNVIVKMVKRLE